ncbi:MAG TPA: hypothetical protein PLF16_00310 [Candidatus Staskawiczbacteria bacterium]|nr:hypothetical protein [Candidatus Staskawiczbacteria bacterium]
MKNTKYIPIFIGIILLFSIGFAYSQYRANKTNNTMPSVSDGEYYVQIVQIDLANQTAVFKHITYFSGTDAFSSAEHEVQCDKGDITECVPSLKRGYYIRPTSPESDFSMKLNNPRISLSNNKDIPATLQDLDKEVSLPQYESAFKINVRDNKIESLEEITRYNGSETFSLPKGYTIDSYKVEKTTEISCQTDGDCKTPAEYLMRSSCPFTSICNQNKCVVVCPENN